MLIVCPNCATSYDVAVASLKPDGRRVRCVRCRAIWLAELSHADKLIAAAEALAPVRRAVEAVAEMAAEARTSDLPGEPPRVPADPADAWSADQAAAEAPVEAAAEAAEAAEEPSFGEAPEVDSPPIAPADFDAVEPPRTPASATDGAFDNPAEVEPLDNVEQFAARRAGRRGNPGRWSRWSLTRVQSVTLALIVLDAIVVGWRTDFVRLMPQTASFYAAIGLPVNLRGLDFDNLTTSTEQHENVPILVVEGAVVNDSHKMSDVPHLRFAVRNAAHQEIYSWTAAPPRTTLPPGEAVSFRTRLASPPPDAHDVLVRFLNRYDIMNGTR
ncbi:MAG: zinc-ribbon domain-containing protein [Xanthobacteraceae bacterium]